MDLNGPVIKVILNDKIIQPSTDSAVGFVHDQIDNMKAKCVRCNCAIDRADTWSLWAVYEADNKPDFKCWVICDPCTKRCIEFAKEGI